jgi:hypothetical protein
MNYMKNFLGIRHVALQRFRFLTASGMRMAVIWVVVIALITGAVNISEISVNVCKTTWCNP